MAAPTPPRGFHFAAWPLLCCCCCALLLVGATKATHSEVEQQASLQKLFTALDHNRDGQLDAEELQRHLEELRSSATGFDVKEEGWSAAQAVHASQETLDGPDLGDSVSAAELQRHLRALLQDHRVVDWIRHGLNLPQYAPAFKHNAITALDFPLLLSDGGDTLQQDLGVASKLHQQQILRGLKRLILGLGELPSAPRQLECSTVNRTAVRVSWQAPEAPGHPVMHKYVLQRQRITAAAASSRPASASMAAAAAMAGGSSTSSSAGSEDRWEAVAAPDDEDGSWLDAPPAKGSYRYRLAAWSAYGHSPYAVSSGACTVRAVQKQPPPAALPLAPAEAHVLLVAAAAAANLSAAQAAAAVATAGGAWTWSAASSAAVVAVTILLKASQLHVGSTVAAACRSVWARLTGQQQVAAAADGEEQQQAGAGGRMLRVGSSRASLHSLGNAEEELLLLQAHGSLLRNYSSTQLLSSGEPSTHFGNMQVEASGLDAAALAAAADAGEAAAEQLHQAIQRGAHCAHPSCHRRFDRLRDMRRKLESHYCGLCQHMYCLQHTRISPHGARGGCGLESKCVCHACFAELVPAQQAAYERINRLPKPSSTGAAAAAGGDGAAEPAVAAAAVQAAEAPLDPAAGCSGKPASEVPAEPADAHAAASGAAAEAHGQPSAAATAGSSHGGGGSSSSARLRWKKAGGALRALVRFKVAGSNPSSPRHA